MLNSDFEYIDGNGNIYKIQIQKICTMEYFPVKPITSSSGIYDGGQYIKKILTQNQLDDLLIFIEKLSLIESYKIDKRVKGSGMIIRDKDKKKEIFIFDPKCSELKALENHLEKIKFSQ